MNLTNWLIYRFAKTALFFSAGLSLLIAVFEIISLLTGNTPTISFGGGSFISFDRDPVGAGSFTSRLLLLLPASLVLLAIAYSSWQLAMLLQDIRKGNAFLPANTVRVKRIGLAMIGANLLLLIFQIIYRSPANEYRFSTTWFVMGCVFLILSQAFAKGATVQEDSDLSI